MTMHIVRGITTTGSRRGKQQFRNSQQAKQSRELAAEWQKLNDKWSSVTSFSTKKSPSLAMPKSSKSLPIRQTENVASLNSWHTGAVSSKSSQQYTGTKMIGISTLHKSNAVPVFTEQEAIDIAHMRR